MLHRRTRFLLAALFAICSPPVYAQTVDHETVAGHENAHELHKNVVSFFAGLTHSGRRDNAAALGVAYERLLSKSFAIGALAEHTFGNENFTVYAVPFSYRVDRWKFYVAPGIEDSDDHGTESLVRLAAEYAFEVDSWEISPQFAVDFVDGDRVLILGVAFGKGF